MQIILLYWWKLMQRDSISVYVCFFSQGRRGVFAGTELLGRSCAPDAVQVYRGYFQKSFGLSVLYPSSEHIKLQFLHEKSRMI